jgi:transketolase
MEQPKATRDGFGEALAELGRVNERIVVLSGDLEDSTRAEYFKKEFPGRFFNLGIAEQDLVGTAAGLSKEGFIPFVCSFAAFLTSRAYDMIRLSVCYNKCNVKLIGSHGGLSAGPDGATVQSLEDFAVMRVLPNLSVVCPADAMEAKKATKAIASAEGPFYMRLSRPPSPLVTDADDVFRIGKADTIREGSDLTIAACGIMVLEAVRASKELRGENISARVVNFHTIKPVDADMIIKCAGETGAFVIAEDHQAAGGLGGAIMEVLAKNCPVPAEMTAVNDSFGESGTERKLLEAYSMTYINIMNSAKKALERKNRVKQRGI